MSNKTQLQTNNTTLDSYISRINVAEEVAAGLSEVDTIYENGKADKEREFWDIITANNTRTDYEIGFRYWDIEYLKPPYKIIPTTKKTLNQTFYKCKKLKAIEPDYIDFSQKQKGTTFQEGLYYTFFHCEALKELKDIGIPAEFGLYGTFDGCWQLEDLFLRVDENTKFNGAFSYCDSLKSVTFEGVIGQNGIDLHWSPLTHDTLMNIINCLKDYSADTSGASHTVTLGTTNLNKLTDAEKAIATEKGWTLV